MTKSTDSNAILLKYASLLGATGIAAGAFGAHALKDTLAKRGTLGTWQTAVLYQLVHATALVGLYSMVIVAK